MLKLVGVEMVEFLTPIAYALTFSIAFYGPNASMIGGVRFSGWGFQEVTDVESFLVESGMMFVADFACTIGSGMLLWKFSSVNMLEEGYKLLSLYWPLIAINLAGSMFSGAPLPPASLIQCSCLNHLDLSSSFRYAGYNIIFSPNGLMAMTSA